MKNHTTQDQINTMTTEILCTLGPSSMNERVIKRLEELDVSLLRINLSHTQVSDVAETIRYIQKYSSVPICLDSIPIRLILFPI